jgi:phosphohistidine phosphatase
VKRIFLIRHAKAVKDIPGIYDIERPLSPKGYSQAKLISSALFQSKYVPELIITSPAVRAYSTALILFNQFALKPSHLSISSNLYYTTLDEHKKIITSLDNSIQSVMLIGHNNELSLFRDFLCNRNFSIPIKTSEVYVLESTASQWKDIELANWENRAVITPSDLSLR